MKTCKFETLGCKVNQYDTQMMRSTLAGLGIREAVAEEIPDFVILNTCTVTGTGDRKSRYLIRRLGRTYPKARLVVTGCYAQLDKDALLKMPEVSACVGAQELDRLPAIVKEWVSQDFKTGGACTDIPAMLDTGNASVQNFSGRTRAYLKVMDGCNYKCSFCKVRIARGFARSRSFDELVSEARQLVEGGHREIVLVGIQLGYYGRDLSGHRDLVDLIKALEALEGLRRIRLSSIEPKDITPRLIEQLAVSKKLCPHVHMPWQSGDDTVLHRMRRSYRRAELIRLASQIRSKVPDAALTTDIMVGFPGEGEHEFSQTLDLVRQVKPSRVHIFPYSDREGTDAAHYPDKVAPDVKKERALVLRRAAQREADRFHAHFIGRSVRVLVEGPARESEVSPVLYETPGVLHEGYTENYIKTRFMAQQSLENCLVWLRIERVLQGHIFGNLLSVDQIG